MIGPRWPAAVVIGAVLGLLGAARPAGALDLAETLRQVAHANPTLAARAASADAARRRIGPAGAWPAPVVEAGVENLPAGGSFDTDMMTMKVLGLTQTVPVSGAKGLARRSARAAATAAEAGAENARNEVLASAWRAYGDAYYAARLAALADDHHAVIDRMVEAARVRYEAGRGRLEDVLRTQAERATLGVDAATLRAEATGARARLDALRGVAVSEDTLAAPPAVAVPDSAAPWLAAIADSHPRLREARASVDRWREAAGAERRRTWPDLELRGAYGWREPLYGLVHQENLFTATVSFTLPIFAGDRSSNAAEMDAMARASEAESKSAGLTLYAEIVAAHAEALGAQARATTLADTVITLQSRALEAAWTAYRGGSGDMWRVFESAHALYDEEIAAIRARQELAHAVAQLVALTGRTDLFGVPMPGGER